MPAKTYTVDHSIDDMVWYVDTNEYAKPGCPLCQDKGKLKNMLISHRINNVAISDKGYDISCPECRGGRQPKGRKKGYPVYEGKVLDHCINAEGEGVDIEYGISVGKSSATYLDASFVFGTKEEAEKWAKQLKQTQENKK